jgi:hypothetical protein
VESRGVLGEGVGSDGIETEQDDVSHGRPPVSSAPSLRSVADWWVGTGASLAVGVGCVSPAVGVGCVSPAVGVGCVSPAVGVGCVSLGSRVGSLPAVGRRLAGGGSVTGDRRGPERTAGAVVWIPERVVIWAFFGPESPQ